MIVARERVVADTPKATAFANPLSILHTSTMRSNSLARAFVCSIEALLVAAGIGSASSPFLCWNLKQYPGDWPYAAHYILFRMVGCLQFEENRTVFATRI